MGKYDYLLDQHQRRWCVERPNGSLNIIKANRMDMTAGGALSFRHEGRLEAAYAPSSWVTVVEQKEEE